MDERDPLAALRAAWAAAEPADPASLGEEELDDATRAVLQRLRSAYALAGPEPAALPWRIRLRARRRTLRRAAAAALVLALAAAAARELSRAPPRAPGPERTPIAVEPEAPESSGILLAALTPERMELRSGPVRLILLTPPPGDAPAPELADPAAEVAPPDRDTDHETKNPEETR